jgi:hypothetical protein
VRLFRDHAGSSFVATEGSGELHRWTKADVELQSSFVNDLKSAAGKALSTTTPGEGMDPRDLSNPWALFDNYTDRAMVQCVNSLTPKWSSRLAAFDVFVWDQCQAMEQSLRSD